MTMKMIRAEVELFDDTGDFSLWTIRMMAHFGVSGLKEVVLSDNFDIDIPVTKEEGKKVDDDGRGHLGRKIQTKGDTRHSEE